MVGVTGFEPATSWSRTRRAPNLRYTPESGTSACRLKPEVPLWRRVWDLNPRIAVLQTAALPLRQPAAIWRFKKRSNRGEIEPRMPDQRSAP